MRLGGVPVELAALLQVSHRDRVIRENFLRYPIALLGTCELVCWRSNRRVVPALLSGLHLTFDPIDIPWAVDSDEVFRALCFSPALMNHLCRHVGERTGV